MKQNKDYAVFILTYGRPEKVHTYELLRSSGYTGKIYLIVDDSDKTLNQYIEKYKEQVVVFSKKDYKEKFDIMDNFDGDNVIVYARNACYDIARSLNLNYFLEFEDDYTSFNYRFADDDRLASSSLKKFDDLADLIICALDKTKAFTIAFAQGGEMQGGIESLKRNNYKRKAMNTFFFKVNKDKKNDILFVGRMNDDVNTYLTHGKVGKLFFQITGVNVNQKQTQSNDGGNTDAYKSFGTYMKSFYSVIAAPNCCKISVLGVTNPRIHHKINWNNAVPKIIDESYKK